MDRQALGPSADFAPQKKMSSVAVAGGAGAACGETNGTGSGTVGAARPAELSVVDAGAGEWPPPGVSVNACMGAGVLPTTEADGELAEPAASCEPERGGSADGRPAACIGSPRRSLSSTPSISR